jgi:hypothetical protein
VPFESVVVDPALRSFLKGPNDFLALLKTPNDFLALLKGFLDEIKYLKYIADLKP